MNFTQLGLTPAILSALEELGYKAPTPIQEGAIPPALAGKDVLGLAQTGTGKTCAFAAPILQRLAQAHHKGPRVIRALILTPTRELALQIQESFEHYGKRMPLRSAVIFGGVGQNPQVEKIRRGLDILVATPGRLLDLQGQGLLDLSHVEIFVLDEADRMLDMGFIHDVRRILKLLPDKKQTLFFSATMPPEVTELVNALLHDPARVAVTPVSSPVEAIDQSLYYVDRKNKTKLLAHLVNRPEVKNALVFSRTKHGANKIAQELEKLGVSAAAIHGNKSQTARQQALADFKAGRVKVLAATDIAARGIDIEELSHVFNYNLPDVPETYVHRIGRTGRAGRGGTAVTFCEFGEKDDLKAVEKLLGKPIPVVEEHPWPMEVFEAPMRDKHGRIVNPEDQEARMAARERKKLRDQERAGQGPKKLVDKAAKQGEQRPLPSRKPVAPPPSRREQRPPVQPPKKEVPRTDVRARTPGQKRQAAGYKPSRTLDDALTAVSPKSADRDDAFARWMAEEEAIRAKQGYTDALSGDTVMDATARLLAPRRPTASSGAEHAERPQRRQRGGGEGARKKQTEAPKAAQGRRPGRSSAQKPVKAAPAAERRPDPAPQPKPQRENRGRSAGRSRGPMEPVLRPSTQKDSTEHESLMKPYYLNEDD